MTAPDEDRRSEHELSVGAGRGSDRSRLAAQPTAITDKTSSGRFLKRPTVAAATPTPATAKAILSR